MTNYHARFIFAVILSVLMAACAGGISKQVRSQVTYTGGFADLQQRPDRYVGETVILGGRVIETRVAQGLTELVILHLELNSSDRPALKDQSQGRYLVQAQQFLDPALYPQGTLITVVGRVQGSEDRAIDRMTYAYPVIQLLEIKKWEPRDLQSPRFHFGIGVGTRF